MRTSVHLASLVGFSLLLCGSVSAQSPTRVSGPVSISGPPGTRVIRVPAAQPTRSTTLPVAVSPGSVSLPSAPANLLLGDYPVPGLGFDYTHLAAVNRDLHIRALVDPVTQAQLNLARQIRRETPVAPIGPVFFNSTQVIVLPQPPIVIIQEAPLPPPASTFPGSASLDSPPPVVAAPPPVSAPIRDIPEFVFARRDGALLFAVAFTASADHIVFVTRNGLRRTLLLADLDYPATLGLNEERGASIQLPR